VPAAVRAQPPEPLETPEETAERIRSFAKETDLPAWLRGTVEKAAQGENRSAHELVATLAKKAAT